jgi:MFS family permease
MAAEMTSVDRTELTFEEPISALADPAGGLSARALPAITKRKQARRASVEKAPSLLHDEAFLLFWISRVLTQTAQGAIVYALLILVADRTDASFFNSLFVACAIVPALFFGLPAGVVVDTLPRRPLLLCLNILRFFFALALVANEPSLIAIFAAALGLWTIHQFYSPAESSLMAALVPRGRLTNGQSLSNLALTISQALGLVVLAPLLLKVSGPEALFGVCALLFIGSTICVGLLPAVEDHLHGAAPLPIRRLRESLAGGWRSLRRDHVLYEVSVDDVLVGIGGSALIVITPLYLKGVLNTGAENTVFVFAPAALGLVLGLRVSHWMGRMLGQRRVATYGLMLFSICIGLLGFVEPVHEFLNDGLRLPVDPLAGLLHLPPLIMVVMALSIPAGFASSIVGVASRSVLLARTPASSRGQVIATQNLIQNVGALVPTLLAGLAADLFGVERVAVALAVLIAAGAIAALTKYRPVVMPSVAEAP